MLTLAVLAGCSASAPPQPSVAATTQPSAVDRPLAPGPAAGPRSAERGDSCALLAAAAATISTPGGTLGPSRQAATRSYGTPRLQALYDGTGQGRDPQQELWQQHHAHVLAHAQPAAADLHHDHEHDEGTVADHQAPAPAGADHAAVIVTGTAHGDGGWTAPVAPYRLECLLLRPGPRLARRRPAHRPAADTGSHPRADCGS